MKKTTLLLLSSFFILSCADKNKNSEKTIAIAENSDTPAVFKWTTELCDNTGTYDPAKYTEAELKNTYDLWFTFSGTTLETDATATTTEDIEKLNSDQLLAEYNKKKALYNREIVSTPFWNKLKRAKLQELEAEYELKKITIEAYSNPSILLNNKYSKYCSEYATVLASNDSIALLNSWRNLIEEQKAHNGSPEKFMERYNEKYNSEDRLLYAKMELMTYGWWNCGNGQIQRINDDGTFEKEFNKLFIQVKSECDEP